MKQEKNEYVHVYKMSSKSVAIYQTIVNSTNPDLLLYNDMNTQRNTKLNVIDQIRYMTK